MGPSDLYRTREYKSPFCVFKNQHLVIGQYESTSQWQKSKTKHVVFDWLDFLIDQSQGAGFWCPRGGLCVRKGYLQEWYVHERALPWMWQLGEGRRSDAERDDTYIMISPNGTIKCWADVVVVLELRIFTRISLHDVSLSIGMIHF